MNKEKWFVMLLGFCVGGMTGYIVAKKVLESQDEFEEVKQLPEEEEPDWVKLEEETEEEEKPAPVKQPRKKGRKAAQKKEPVDYTQYHTKETKPSLKDVAKKAQETPVEEEDENERDPGEPRIINLEEYTTDDRYAKRVWTYYEGDDTLCDENEDIISDPDRLIGPEGLLKFGVLSNDPDLVYIRNENEGTDFQILRSQRKYAVHVMGLKDSDAKGKNTRRASRKKQTEEEDE